MFNSIGRSSNFAQAGKSAADDMVRSFAAARRNSPDYGKLAETAATIRSKEKQAAMKAAAAVTKTGIQAAGNVQSTKIKIEAEGNLKKSKRKAGALATAGQLFGTAGSYAGEKRSKREVGSEDSWYDERINTTKKKAADLRKQAEEYGTTTETNDATPSTGNTGGSKPGKVSSTAGTSGGGQETAMQYMSTLTKEGYTPVQAAGIVGNAQYESANFTAYEELEPNAYGTRGAGVFQWTNAGSSNRRDNFENWSASQGLDPKSFEANSGFMIHEMQGNAGNHWTGGMNDQGYRQISDLNTAVTSFQNNYLRPNKDKANTQQRLTYAQQALQNWQNRNS
tara:strand:+ start:774 stop:1784 length:1011 start_codon:yes stop_codon:yes gene_type:complete